MIVSVILHWIARLTAFAPAMLFAIIMSGCSGSGSDGNNKSGGSVQTVVHDDGFVEQMAYSTGIADSAQYLTLNIDWGLQSIGKYDIAWWGKTGYQNDLNDGSKKIQEFTQTLKEYKQRNQACRADENNPDGKCYTVLKHRNNGAGAEILGCPDNTALEFNSLRYGYYCGADHPVQDVTPFNHSKQPLDPVDYCCRLHDDATWADDEAGKACGMMLCLQSAEATSGLFSTIMGETGRARQCWFDMSSKICRGAGDLTPPGTVSPVNAPIKIPNPAPPFEPAP